MQPTYLKIICIHIYNTCVGVIFISLILVDFIYIIAVCYTLLIECIDEKEPEYFVYCQFIWGVIIWYFPLKCIKLNKYNKPS